MALLTPKDIREHTFQTVRFKEGYDVDEVDDFLDQVTETVEALGKQAVASGQGYSVPRPGCCGAQLQDFRAQRPGSVPAAGERDIEVRLRAGSWRW